MSDGNCSNIETMKPYASPVHLMTVPYNNSEDLKPTKELYFVVKNNKNLSMQSISHNRRNST